MSDEERWRWLASTRELQERFFKADFSIMETDPDHFADAIVWNHTALVVELGEFMNEVGWKTWSVPRGWVNREAAIGELVDAGHFMANMLTYLGVDDDEWERRYRAKQEVNRQRQRDGYDARSRKCPGCHRAYDDPGVECTDQRVLAGVHDDAREPATDVVHSAWCAVQRRSF